MKYLLCLIPLFLCQPVYANHESVIPSDEGPIVIQQDSFGNTYAQQPGQGQYRFSPNGTGSYQYQQGLDHWGSVQQSGSGTSTFDNRLDGSYRYSFTPASPVPGVKNEIEIHGGARGAVR